MIKYHFFIEALYKEPTKPLKKNHPTEGYFQHFGVTAQSLQEALAEIEKMIAFDRAEIIKFECQENVAFDRLPQEIVKNSRNPEEKGIWYKGGKAVY